MKFKILLLSLMIFPMAAWSSGTVVRDGGDPIFYFLEATRYSLVETVKLLQLEPKESAKFCQLSTLTKSQIEYCQKYFSAIATQILILNQGTNKTLFVLREEPLLVLGPDGKPMPVAARTALDSTGEIEYHRDSLKLMAPANILFLMAHEFQHKSVFENHYVTDNEIIGPFRNGRELIDTVASAIVEVAKRRGKVGSQYVLRDSFDCTEDVGGVRFGVRSSSPRLFLGEDMMNYETSLSRNPSDALIYVPENAESSLVFRVKISEPYNCKDDTQYLPLRSTQLQIVRVFNANGGSTQPAEQILTESTMTAYNPMCIVNGGTISLTYQNVRFSCHYYGTEGIASQVLRIK
jgi:hypothetical protein